MRIVAVIIGFFFLKLGISQEQGNYAYAAKNFTERYNARLFDLVFSSFGPDMQKALPIERTKTFLQGTYNVMGAIKYMDFSKTDQGAHVYLAEFEKALAEVVISLDPKGKINALQIRPIANADGAYLERNTTKMMLPFEGEWFVFWGGTTVAQNYHVDYPDQKFAYDLLKVKDGASYSGDALKNESYFAFGENILAPCNAIVAKVIDGVPDNVPGKLNPLQLTGNTIVLKTADNEYLLFAHLKQESILVTEGQEVLRGEVMAQCGNSGNSSEPHLHLSLQNHEDMLRSKGGKLYFDRILVNGKLKDDYLPVKEDFIRNLE